MYGLPADIDLKSFNGKELTQVCMGSAQFQLHFSDGKSEDASVFVECGWKLHAGGDRLLDFSADTPDRPQEAAWLARLIGQSVVNAEAIYPGTLRLNFSDGWIVDVIEDAWTFESYQIKIDGKLIIV